MSERKIPVSVFEPDRAILTRMNGTWLVFRPLAYDLGRKNSGLRITVPKDYSSDLASIHWSLQWFLPRRGKHDGPALLHDWLYNTHLVSRPIADAIFHEALLVCGVSPFKAWVMVTAVRFFGGPAYRRGPDTLRKRAPEWAHLIFDQPALEGREKERM